MIDLTGKTMADLNHIVPTRRNGCMLVQFCDNNIVMVTDVHREIAESAVKSGKIEPGESKFMIQGKEVFVSIRVVVTNDNISIDNINDVFLRYVRSYRKVSLAGKQELLKVVFNEIFPVIRMKLKEGMLDLAKLVVPMHEINALEHLVAEYQEMIDLKRKEIERLREKISEIKKIVGGETVWNGMSAESQLISGEILRLFP